MSTNRGRNNGRTRVRKRRPCPFKKPLRNVSRPCIVTIATRVYDQTDKTNVVRGSHEEERRVRQGKKTERIKRKKRSDARKRRETWPTDSCSSRLTGFAHIKPNNKIWNTGRRPHVPLIFQGRFSRRCFNVRKDTRKIATRWRLVRKEKIFESLDPHW